MSFDWVNPVRLAAPMNLRLATVEELAGPKPAAPATSTQITEEIVRRAAKRYVFDRAPIGYNTIIGETNSFMENWRADTFKAAYVAEEIAQCLGHSLESFLATDEEIDLAASKWASCFDATDAATYKFYFLANWRKCLHKAAFVVAEVA